MCAPISTMSAPGSTMCAPISTTMSAPISQWMHLSVQMSGIGSTGTMNDLVIYLEDGNHGVGVLWHVGGWLTVFGC